MPLDKQLVQDKLNMMGYGTPFTIIFEKADGSQRKMKAMMEKPTKPIDYSKPIAVKNIDEGKWGSFKVDKVLYMEQAYD